MVAKILKTSGSWWLFVAGSIFLSGAIAGAAGMMAPQYSPYSPADQLNQAISNGVPDRDFVSNVYRSGMAEVQLGKLAAQKGSSDDVKQFGQKMVDDRTQLNGQMEWAAQHMHLKLPSGISKKDKRLIVQLQGMSGTQFDDAYIVAMVKAHKDDAETFQTEAGQTKNPNLQRLAQQGSDTIAQDQQRIEKIAESHNLMTAKGRMISGDK
ncbi:MAG TPA: DUF4142 domain-containing protein [Acidobacteriaceae bacterium]|jgi:putative membrane protein|nr:DUF4142 domain-containing protein [Acidobacteriaceae bacterium]